MVQASSACACYGYCVVMFYNHCMSPRKFLSVLYIVLPLLLLVISVWYITTLRADKSLLQQEIDSINSKGVKLLEKNGYNIIAARAEIVNPGMNLSITTDSIELKMNHDGRWYIKKPGDFDVTKKCTDNRNALIEHLGGRELIAPNMEACIH